MTSAAAENAAANDVTIACIEERANELVETLRAALVCAGARESRSAGQDGLYFVGDGDGTVCLEYCEPDRKGSLPPAALLRRRDVAVLHCCPELARLGHPFTLFVSPHTLSLTVRTD